MDKLMNAIFDAFWFYGIDNKPKNNTLGLNDDVQYYIGKGHPDSNCFVSIFVIEWTEISLIV